MKTVARKKGTPTSTVGNKAAFDGHSRTDLWKIKSSQSEEYYALVEEYFGSKPNAHFMDYHTVLSELIHAGEDIEKDGPSRPAVDRFVKAVSVLTQLGVPAEPILPRMHRKQWLTMLTTIKRLDILSSPVRQAGKKTVTLRGKDANQAADFFGMIDPRQLELKDGELTGLQSFASMCTMTLPILRYSLGVMVIEIREEDFNIGSSFDLLERVINDKGRKGVKCTYNQRHALADNLKNPRHKDRYGELADALKWKKGKGKGKLRILIPPSHIKIIAK